jgi:hypothetical protein
VRCQKVAGKYGMDAEQLAPEGAVVVAVNVRTVVPLHTPSVVLEAATTVPAGSTIPPNTRKVKLPLPVAFQLVLLAFQSATRL